MLAADDACSHDLHSFGVTLKCRHTSFSKFFNIFTWFSELWKKSISRVQYDVYRCIMFYLASRSDTHPVESNRRYERHPRRERICHFAVLCQKAPPLFRVRTFLYRFQVDGYSFGAHIHYPYRVNVILDHARHKLQLYRWVLNDVDGASVYDVRLTLDRSVLACELVLIVPLCRLCWKSNM